MTLILALAAGAQARDAARLADETHKAGDLMQYLTTLTVTGGLRQGVTGEFAWTVSDSRSEAPGNALAICRRNVELTSRATRRRYALVSGALCSVGETR